MATKAPTTKAATKRSTTKARPEVTDKDRVAKAAKADDAIASRKELANAKLVAEATALGTKLVRTQATMAALVVERNRVIVAMDKAGIKHRPIAEVFGMSPMGVRGVVERNAK